MAPSRCDQPCSSPLFCSLECSEINTLQPAPVVCCLLSRAACIVAHTRAQWLYAGSPFVACTALARAAAAPPFDDRRVLLSGAPRWFTQHLPARSRAHSLDSYSLVSCSFAGNHDVQSFDLLRRHGG